MPPVLYLAPDRARANYLALMQWMQPLRIRYATKANPHPALLAALAHSGAHFAIVSAPELEALLVLGVPGERIACVNPGPPASLLRRCRAAGVRQLAADSVWELRKAAALVPGAAVCLTLRLPPAGRLRYPAAPVGAPLEALEALLAAARELPVELCGVAVHVGSQCERLAPWHQAVALAAAAWQRLRAAGYAPWLLNLGGGLPVHYRRPVPHPTTIARTLQQALAAHFPSLPAERWLEPGRYIAAGAGVLAATVLARHEHDGRCWLTLDVGRYHGLPEAPLGIRYPYYVPASALRRRQAPRRCVLLGPLGPRLDVLDRTASLPPLRPGDRLYLLQAGAYTACQAAYPVSGRGPRVVVLPPGVQLEDVFTGAWAEPEAAPAVQG
jgi:ornithine decarboxylase